VIVPRPVVVASWLEELSGPAKSCLDNYASWIAYNISKPEEPLSTSIVMFVRSEMAILLFVSLLT